TRTCSPRARGCSRMLPAVRLGPVVAPRLLVAAEVEVLVELELVGAEHVRGRRDARELDDLERDHPAVVRALRRRHRLDGPPEEGFELLAGAGGDLLRVVEGSPLDRLRCLRLVLELLRLLPVLAWGFGLALLWVVLRFLFLGCSLVLGPSRSLLVCAVLVAVRGERARSGC